MGRFADRFGRLGCDCVARDGEADEGGDGHLTHNFPLKKSPDSPAGVAYDGRAFLSRKWVCSSGGVGGIPAGVLLAGAGGRPCGRAGGAGGQAVRAAGRAGGRPCGWHIPILGCGTLYCLGILVITGHGLAKFGTTSLSIGCRRPI
jgi:hypothetical protein